jgi:hypothetical protein
VGDKVTVRLPLQGLSILRFGAYRSYFTVLLPERCGGDQYLRYHTRLDLIRCLGVGLMQSVALTEPVTGKPS